MSFQRALIKIRRDVPSDQVPTPRCTNPVPLEGCPARQILGSYFHNSFPVREFSAATAAYGVGTYIVSPMTTGEASNIPGCDGF